ncbi:MAG: hypothetical protein ABIG80_01920, partial [Patescibacteria group bacterium]
DIGIVSGKDTQAAKIFEELFPNFLELPYKVPSEYISKCWDTYVEYDKKKNLAGNSNGEIFEYLLATLFIKEGLLPLFLQANVAFVPNVSFDLMLYTLEKGPICLSAKTSLRERYKQADLEAMALKNVHRKSISYLITLDKKEAANLKAKIEKGDTLGLDKVIIATETEFDQMIVELVGYTITEPPQVEVIEANKKITEEKIKNLNLQTPPSNIK